MNAPSRIKPPTPKNLLGTLLHRIATLILIIGPAILSICAVNTGICDDKKSVPNIVLILADDLGWADLGCYGSKFHRTPHLDQLATRGVRFTEGYAACCVCSPSRAAILTGQSPVRFQLTDWLPGRGDRADQPLARPALQQQLPLEAITLAEALKGAGYTTGHIGKWHLGGTGYLPGDQGFESNVAGLEIGTPFSYLAPFRSKNKQGNERFLPGLEQAADGEYLTDRLGEEAAKFIGAHKERPFFLYLAHYAPHTPMVAKPGTAEKFGSSTASVGRQANAIYAAMLESLDNSIGTVMQALEEHKLTDNTLVIFTSDNGGLATNEGPHTPATINSPLREGKGYLYEGGLRVPFIAHWPARMKAGSVSSVPVVGYDIFSTVLDACGVSVPHAVDGKSFLPQLAGGEQELHEAIAWHYPHYSNQGGKPGGAIRVGKHKLIEFYESGRKELFDVAANSGEGKNIIAEQPAIAEELAKKLAQWRENTGALLPTANPQYKPNPPGKNGVIAMHCSTAQVHGVMLRHEPLPHKNTLGYWVNAADYATFEFTVEQPGKYEVVAWQGCGGNNGGSEVDFIVGEQTLKLTVKETGGFQKFEPVSLGHYEFASAGRQTLTVKPKQKAKAAVMDLQLVELKPVAR
jgi:arylsulfatase A